MVVHDAIDHVAAEKAKTNPPPQTPLLKSAPPPWHAVAVVVAQLSLFLKIAPSLSSLDEISTLDALTNRIFPELITIRTLGCLRAIMALVIWATSIYTVFLDRDGFEVDTSYFPNSKLRKATFHLNGWKSLAPFTHVSWIMLGIAFSLNSIVCFGFFDNNNNDDIVFSWTKRLALITWEIAAPAAFLTSMVVTYVIIPGAVRKSKVNGYEPGELDLFQTRTLLMHNANIFFCFVEICLLGGLPVTLSHVALAPLYGMVYVVVAWNTTSLYADDFEKDGPQFLYNFFDTTLGTTTTIALLALLVVLMVGYLVMSKVLDILDSMGGGMFVHIVATIALSWATCRIRP